MKLLIRAPSVNRNRECGDYLPSIASAAPFFGSLTLDVHAHCLSVPHATVEFFQKNGLALVNP